MNYTNFCLPGIKFWLESYDQISVIKVLFIADDYIAYVIYDLNGTLLTFKIVERDEI